MSHERRIGGQHRTREHVQQLTFFRRGGKRRGAGRKPKGKRALVAHVRREAFDGHTPAQITSRLRPNLPSLRTPSALEVIRAAFAAGTERFGFRVVHFGVQSNHVHLIVEARDRCALARGLKGLNVRVARALNKLWRRTGSVFADRYQARVLRTPREVRNSLAYVINDARHHGIYHIEHHDPFSSGDDFDGWLEKRCARNDSADNRATFGRAHSWLLNVGWRKHGLLRTHEVPGRG